MADTKREADRVEVNGLRRENEQLKAVVAEPTLKNRVLKKSLLDLGTEWLPDTCQFREPLHHERADVSLDNLIPAEVYFGGAKEVLTRREKVKQKTLRQRRLQNLQSAGV